MAKKKIHMLKKLKTLPNKVGVHGAVSIRPVSFGMDKTIDKYIVSGGGHRPVVTGSKSQARKVANARLRVMKKRKARKKRRKK